MLNFHFHPSKIRRYFNSKLYNGKKLQKKNCWYFKIISFLVSSWYVFNFYEFFTINVESLIFHFPKMEGKKSNIKRYFTHHKTPTSSQSKYPVLHYKRGFWWYGISVFGPFGQTGQYWKNFSANYKQILRAVFSCFHGQKKIFFSKHCSIRTKKLHNISFGFF